jgi:hypothetical protein
MMNAIEQTIIQYIELINCSELKFRENFNNCLLYLKLKKNLLFEDIRYWQHFFLSIYTSLMNAEKKNYTVDDANKRRSKSYVYKRRVIKALHTAEECTQELFSDIAYNDKYRVNYAKLSMYHLVYDNYKLDKQYNNLPEIQYKVEKNTTGIPSRYNYQFQQDANSNKNKRKLNYSDTEEVDNDSETIIKVTQSDNDDIIATRKCVNVRMKKKQII